MLHIATQTVDTVMIIATAGLVDAASANFDMIGHNIATSSAVSTELLHIPY